MTFRASAPFTEQWKHFRFAVADGVATVTFDRPDRLNALTLDVYADLRDLFTEVEHRDDVAVAHAEFFKAQAEKRPPAWTGR